MNNSNPLISVIVPCYNQGQYLDDCLQSVMDQTYTNWECIIVNDGSPDDTESVAKKWVSRDSRFKYLYKENGGLSSARNAGLSLVKGEWIQFLDCDDVIKEKKIEISSSYFVDYECVVTDFAMFDAKGLRGKFCNYLNLTIDYSALLYGWDWQFNIPIHAGLFKSKHIHKFKEDLKSKEDWIFWLDFFKDPKVSCKIIPEQLALYRDNPKSMSKDIDQMNDAENVVFKLICDNYCRSDSEVYNFLLTRINDKNKIIKVYLNKYNSLLYEFNNYGFRNVSRLINFIKRKIKMSL
ncbi:glycosyltransferase family 2 protein [Sphingobacterium bovistauri]|uniref:Glycosyltransferase family 2 protein n=1 Tax=Sphingobacterium bovistauri TaxID=2781959 RepID=A0ABS7Z1Q9_9SPHI|nr:glycosyltransferase family 2 protein [Sphingobacterium bovistauri]MCA5004114.1 glycosyltransferase family 2 protein [Sphingobacterium bovistauri]